MMADDRGRDRKVAPLSGDDDLLEDGDGARGGVQAREMVRPAGVAKEPQAPRKKSLFRKKGAGPVSREEDRDEPPFAPVETALAEGVLSVSCPEEGKVPARGKVAGGKIPEGVELPVHASSGGHGPFGTVRPGVNTMNREGASAMGHPDDTTHDRGSPGCEVVPGDQNSPATVTLEGGVPGENEFPSSLSRDGEERGGVETSALTSPAWKLPDADGPVVPGGGEEGALAPAIAAHPAEEGVVRGKKVKKPIRPGRKRGAAGDGTGESSRRSGVGNKGERGKIPSPSAPRGMDITVPGDDLMDDDPSPADALSSGSTGGVPSGGVSDDILADDGERPVVPAGKRVLFGGSGKKGGAGTPAHSPGPSNGNRPGGFLSRIAVIFSRKVRGEMQSLPFHVGPLSEPSLEGALRDVDVTYAVNPPFQYVHIFYDGDEGALRYMVLEPPLSDDEELALSIVEKGFEKMISTDLDMIVGSNREAYLKDRFLTLCTIFGITATPDQQERMFFHLCKKYLGYSHMDTLMKDRYIEDISCNGADIPMYVMHRIYGSVQTNIRFREVELNNFVLRLAQMGGRHISLLQPIRDVTLPDGSRANLTLGSEVTRKGSTFTIRKFRSNPISPIEMMEYGTIDAPQLAYLWILMEYKRSILVSGGTATGKTTMLNVLCSFIPSEYKVVSIEDTAELNLLHPNWIQSVTRSGFGAGESTASGLSGVSGISRRAPGDISLYDLLVAALRQRPEFIIVGEVRGDEAFTLFQAIAVGHAALGTIHAGSINELLARIESNPMNVPRALFSNLDAVIFPMHIMRGERSARRVANITEVLELDRDTGDLITNTAYRWVPDKDEFRFQGRHYLFDKIRETYGVSRETLRQELGNRAAFLDWLRRRGVRDYHQVIRMIRHYQRNRDIVLGRVASDGGVDDLLRADEDDLLAKGTLAGEEILKG